MPSKADLKSSYIFPLVSNLYVNNSEIKYALIYLSFLSLGYSPLSFTVAFFSSSTKPKPN